MTILLVLGIAGCAAGTKRGDDDRDARNETESDSVTAAVRALPGVSRVDGGYQKDASNPGGAVVLSVTVRPDTDLDRTADDVVGLVWRSRLDPLTSMTVTVGPADAPSRAIDRHEDFAFDRAKLTASYGPRPQAS